MGGRDRDMGGIAETTNPRPNCTEQNAKVMAREIPNNDYDNSDSNTTNDNNHDNNSLAESSSNPLSPLRRSNGFHCFCGSC